MKSLTLALLIFPVVLTLGCKKDEGDITMNTTETTDTTGNNAGPFTFLALGDSYTIGQGVSIDERWPVQLKDSLVTDGIEMQNPMIIAQTGWRTDNLDNGINNANLGDTVFDLVSILIGVNNQYQGRPVEEFRAEYIDLLQRAIDFAGGDKNHVIVLSIPDYGVTPFGYSNKDAIAAAIDEFNAEKQEVTDSMGVRFYNITEISREAETDKSLIAGDSLHPSGKMYKRWVDVIYDDVKQTIAP